MSQLKDLFPNWWDEMAARADNPKEPQGYASGLPKLDLQTDGFLGSDYWIIGADSRIGKTTFALNFALQICKAGGSVCFFITEMSVGRVLDRITSMQTGMDYYAIRHPQHLTSEQWQAFPEVIERVGGYNFDLLAGQTFSSDDICEYVKNLNAKPDVIFVDYIQQMSEAQGVDFVAGLQKASFAFQDLAKSQKICVVALSQISKEGQRTSGMAAHKLKGSSTMFQNADNVIFLERDHDAKDGLKKSLLKVKLDKARYGDSGIYFECIFNLQTGRIKERVQ